MKNMFSKLGEKILDILVMTVINSRHIEYYTYHTELFFERLKKENRGLSKLDFYKKKMSGTLSEMFSDNCPKSLRNDKRFIRLMIRKGVFSAFRNASDEIKNDREFIKKIIFKNPFQIVWISDELKNNKEFILDLINTGKDCGFLNYLKWGDDESLMTEAIKVNDKNLYYIKDELRNNKEFMQKYINICSYYVAGKDLLLNEDFVLEELKRYYKSFDKVDYNLKKDPMFLLKAVKINNDIWAELNKEEKESLISILDFDKMKDFLEKSNLLMTYVNNKLKMNQELVEMAAKLPKFSLTMVHPLIIEEKYIINALQNNPLELKYVNYYNQTDKVCITALVGNVFSYKYLKREIPYFRERSLDKKPEVIAYIGDEFLNDNEFFKKVLNSNSIIFDDKWMDLNSDKKINPDIGIDFAEMIVQKFLKNKKMEEIYKNNYASKSIKVLISENPNILQDFKLLYEKSIMEEVIVFKPVVKRKVQKF